MEENQNTENEKKKVKKNNEKKKGDFFAAHKGEFKKITWPSKDELIKQSITVIVVSLIFGAIIFAYDSAISFTYEKSINMVKNSMGSDSASDGDDLVSDAGINAEDIEFTPVTEDTSATENVVSEDVSVAVEVQ